jgi:DNA-binding HxlR family transcriptional regulator
MSSDIKESSMNAYNLKVLAESCQVNEILKSISSRWKMQILYSISKEVQQFSLLKKAFPSLSDQVLGKRLTELSDEGLTIKSSIPDTMPPQIIYTVTPKGSRLLEIILELHLWGQQEK